MRDVWLKSIRDAILAVFFLGAAALAFLAAAYPGNANETAIFFLGAIACLIVAVIFAGRAVYLPWEAETAAEWEERQKAEAAWSEAVRGPQPKTPDDSSREPVGK